MGLSFGEILVLAILALIVIGPKDLPKILRTAGRLIGQAKRTVADVRRETGLDEVLRGDFRDLERLADHIEKLDPYHGDAPQLGERTDAEALAALQLHEYPAIGADAHGLLPDDAPVYTDGPVYATEELPNRDARSEDARSDDRVGGGSSDAASEGSSDSASREEAAAHERGERVGGAPGRPGVAT